MKRISLFISVLAKLTLCTFLLGQFGGCMKFLSYNERMNTRFPAENFFFNERAEMGQAIYKNDIGKVKQLIAQGHNVNAQPANHQGFTYLMYAVFLKDRFEIMKLLLEAGANPNHLSIAHMPYYQSPYVTVPTIERINYYLPLSLAASNRSINYIIELLTHGANPNLYFESDYGRSDLALFSAVQHPYFENEKEYAQNIKDVEQRIELLLQYGANLNQLNSMNESIINVASDPEIVLYLMDKNIDPELYGKQLATSWGRLLDGGYREGALRILKRLEKMGYPYSDKVVY